MHNTHIDHPKPIQAGICRLQYSNPKFYIILSMDSIVFILSHFLAYLFRFEFELDEVNIDHVKLLLPFILIIKLIIFGLNGLYSGMWRYTNLRDSWKILQACIASTLIIILFVAIFTGFNGYSRSIFLLDGLITFLLCGGARAGIRSYYILYRNGNRLDIFNISFVRKKQKVIKRIVIIGAGSAGEKIAREISDNAHLNFKVIGFLDDDVYKHGRCLHGVQVLGLTEQLPEIASKYDVDEVFIAIPSASGAEIRRLVDICRQCQIKHKVLPGIGEIMNGKVGIRSLRKVNYVDLLGRKPVSLDMDSIQRYLKNKVVLITGCGGSIGSELCRQVIKFAPKSVVLLDLSEYNLFQINMELLHESNYKEFFPILGSIQDLPLINEIFEKYRPNVVFHAAAYKHVPMLEKNPWEAIFNNVLGSRNVMEVANEFGVEIFVNVSTDKAVRPTNVMGATKRITEMLMSYFIGSSTRYMSVRFGNVLGSSGSVIPLFYRQIENGGPVTVTDPNVYRYFMTIQEAAQLILQAGSLGEGGEIFLLEMGTPIRIADMAADLIRLSGKELGKDINIVFTGLREGEKLCEELITEGEGIVGTRHDKIKVLRSNGKLSKKTDNAEYYRWLDTQLSELYMLAGKRDGEGIRRKLEEIVPEYTPQTGEDSLQIANTIQQLPEDQAKQAISYVDAKGKNDRNDTRPGENSASQLS